MSLLIFLACVVLTIIPMWKLCASVDLRPAWSLVCVIPIGTIILLWIVAARREQGY